MFHNIVNYVHGLLDELEGAVRAGRAEVADEVRAELARVRKDVAGVDQQALDGDARVLLGRVTARLAALDGAPAQTLEVGAAAQTQGKARTAKAAPAPEAAVAPPVA